MMQYEIQNYPTIDIEETGRKIESYMRRKNISAAQMQEYLGLSCVQSIYRWIGGNNLPSVDNLYAMSRLFRVSMEEMICGNMPLGRQTPPGEYRRFVAYYQIYRGHYAV